MAQDDKGDVVKILFLWPEWLWRTKQSPSRRNYCRAIGDQPGVEWKLSGPGFTDWDSNLTAMQNIDRIFPGCQAIYGYKLGGTERGEIKGIKECQKHMVVAEAYNECWAGTTTQFGGVMHPGGGTVVHEARKAGLTLLIHHHHSDYDRVKELENDGVQVCHLAHCAPKWFADYALPWDERKGILLTGSLNEQHYPLRCRWKRLIDSGRIQGTYYQRPPNYTKSVEASDALVHDYARAIGSCRIKLGCASVWGYALQHYTEAAMAGCLHVADLTDDPLYEEIQLHVSTELSDDELVEYVGHLAVGDWSIMTNSFKMNAIEQFTTDHYAQRFLALVSKHEQFVE